jgi:hypothetical protein
MKRTLRLATTIVIVLVVAFLAYWFGFRSDSPLRKTADASDYSAVALMSNELFFGRITQETATQLVLDDVYFFTFVPDGTASPSPASNSNSSDQKLKPTLIDTNAKDSLAPTSTYVINKDQVKYSYPLKKDSQVVKTIDEYKSK